MSVERRFAEGRFTTLKRLIPGDSADTVLLGALIAIVLVLVAAGASLATWGTPGWGSPMQIPRQGLGTQILDDVVMNRAGDGFAAWTQARDDGYQVEVAQFLPDSGWGLGIPVDQGVGFGQAKVARLEVSEAGDAFVVWTELVTPAEIWSNRFLSGKGWGSPTLLHRVDNARIVKMVTAMDERGNGIVLWSQGEPDPVNGGEVGRLYASAWIGSPVGSHRSRSGPGGRATWCYWTMAPRWAFGPRPAEPSICLGEAHPRVPGRRRSPSIPLAREREDLACA